MQTNDKKLKPSDPIAYRREFLNHLKDVDRKGRRRLILQQIVSYGIFCMGNKHGK